MSIPNPTLGVSYTFTAQTVNPSIAYDFKIAATADLRVTKVDEDGIVSTLSNPSEYTVSGVGERQGGSVNLIGTYEIGEKVVIDPITSAIQTTTFDYTGTFPSADLESAFDWVCNLAKRALNRAGRAFRLPPEDFATNMVIPSKLSRVDKLVGFDSGGDPYYYDLDNVGAGALLPSSYRKSIAVPALTTVDMGTLTMPNVDVTIRLKLYANVDGTGAVRMREYFITHLTGEGTLIVSNVDNISAGKTGAENVNFTITPGATTLNIDINGSALTLIRTVDTRVLIETITDQNDAAFSYD